MNTEQRRDPTHPLRREKDYRPDGTRRRRWFAPERKYRLSYRRRPFATAASTAAAIIATPLIAYGTTQVASIFENTPYKDSGWSSCETPITWTTDTSNLPADMAETVRPRLAKAFSNWSKESGYTFLDAGESPVVYDNASSSIRPVADLNRNISIYFVNDSESDMLTKSVVGYASPSLVWTDSREITGGYAVFNIDYLKVAGEKKHVALFTHEIGHALGLADSKDSGNIMYYLVDKNSSLGDGDVSGLRAIIKPCTK